MGFLAPSAGALIEVSMVIYLVQQGKVAVVIPG
jgi:hypothetical protein